MLKSLFLRRFSPFLTDIFITSFTAVAGAICNIFLVRIIATGLGPEELGIYTLIRRAVAALLPFTTLTIGIGLARYIALYEGKGQKTGIVLPSALAVSLSCTFLFCCASLPFSGLLSELLFNQKGTELLFILILFLLIGENFYLCLYAYYRGRQKILSANIWNILIIGILPISIAGFFIQWKNVTFIIFGIGCLFYLSLIGLIPKVIKGIRSTSREEFQSMTKKLLTYSIPRAPGSVALTLIFTFGILISPYAGGIANAAYLSIGIWIFSILEVATSGFGMIVLPKAAGFVGSGNEQYLINKLRSMYDLILHIGLFTVIQLFLIVDFLIFIWLGFKYSEAVPIARIIFLAMIPFFFYTMMRSIIDAVEKKAINAFNLYIGLIITISSSLILLKLGLGLIALAIGFDLGLIALGILTHNFMKKRYHIKFLPDNFYSVLLINILMGLFIYFLKYEMISNRFSYQNLAIVLSVQVLCGIIYLLVLKKLGSTWIRDLEERISVRRMMN